MNVTITATFADKCTPEEAVASLAKHLVESLTWRYTPENELRGVRFGVIELRGLTADVRFGAVRHSHPDPADMLYKGDLFGRDLSAEEYGPR